MADRGREDKAFKEQLQQIRDADDHILIINLLYFANEAAHELPQSCEMLQRQLHLAMKAVKDRMNECGGTWKCTKNG